MSLKRTDDGLGVFRGLIWCGLIYAIIGTLAAVALVVTP